MSNSIWHKPSETTDVDNNLIIHDWTDRTYELGYFDDNDMIFRNLRNNDTYFEESMMRWCDVSELIDDYDRTRKALKIAVEVLKRIKEPTAWGTLYQEQEIAGQALEQITALTKGGSNE